MTLPIEMNTLSVDKGEQGKAYYYYFSCPDCDNHYGIETSQDVSLSFLGGIKFRCEGCGHETEWIVAYVKGIANG